MICPHFSKIMHSFVNERILNSLWFQQFLKGYFFREETYGILDNYIIEFSKNTISITESSLILYIKAGFWGIVFSDWPHWLVMESKRHLSKGRVFSMFCHFIILNWNSLSCCVKNVYRFIRPYLGRHNWSGESTIHAVIIKFRTEFTFLDIKPLSRIRRVHIAVVVCSFNGHREMSN